MGLEGKGCLYIRPLARAQQCCVIRAREGDVSQAPASGLAGRETREKETSLLAPST